MSSRTVRIANLMAAMRQLTVANLPGKSGWVAALPILRDMVSFEHDALLWLDEDGHTCDMQMSTPEAIARAPHYLAHFHESRERDVMTTFRDFARSGRFTETPTDIPGFYHSDLHQEVFRPMSVRHLIRFAIRNAGQPLAVLLLGRDGMRSFQSLDSKWLAELERLLAHLLGGTGTLSGQTLIDTEYKGIVIADSQGRIEHATAIARYLLYRLAGLPVRKGTITEHDDLPVRNILRELARRTCMLARGHRELPPAYSALRHDGQYVANAYLMDGYGEGQTRIAIQVELRLPIQARLHQAGILQRLPPREQQLIPLLLRGDSLNEIARHLGLSPHTANTYLRNLYTHLGISRRGELLSALLSPHAGGKPIPAQS